MPVNPVPDGFHTLTPYLVIRGATALVEFLSEAFDAVEMHRTSTPDGVTAHAALQIGDSVVMIGEAGAQMKPMPSCIYMYVEDVDAVYEKALKAGGLSLMEPGDQFYGDRNAGVQDPAGNQWWIATHIEDVGDEELRRRSEERFG